MSDGGDIFRDAEDAMLLRGEVATLKARVKELESWTCPRCGPREFDAERIALEKERDSIRAQLDKVRADRDTMIAVHDEVERERDELRAEVERMRPVYEAAIWYGRATHTDDANCAAGDHDDCEFRVAREALNAALAKEPK